MAAPQWRGGAGVARAHRGKKGRTKTRLGASACALWPNFLYNDGLTGILGPLTPGGAGTLLNSQCAINGGASFVTAAGTDVVLNLSVTRQGSYAIGPRFG